MIDSSTQLPSAEGEPAELLKQFLESGRSEQAFAALVRRCSGLVYASALRRTGNVQTAEEVTQNVFAILARKASSLQRHPSLTAWMYQTTKFEAAKAMRSEQRRQRKLSALAEEAVLQCASELSDADRAAWRDALPILDESLDRLNAKDREVLLQRFFEGQKFRDIAERTGKSEAACKMQVKRVLGKLSQWLSARGVSLSVATLATCLGAEFAKAAPASVVAAASTGGLAAASGVTTGTILTNTVQTMSTVKTATFTTAAVAVVASAPFVWQQSQATSLEKELDGLTERKEVVEQRFLDAPPTGNGGVGIEDELIAGSPRPRTVRELLAAADEPLDAKTLMDDIMRVMMSQDMMGMLRIFLPVSQLSPEEMDDLLAEVQGIEANPQVKTMALQLLTMFSDGGDPAKALERAMKLDIQPYAYAQHLTSWAKKDPEAAVAWFIEKRDAGELDGKGVGRSPKQTLFTRMLAGVATSDADLAIKLFNEADKDTQRRSIHQIASALGADAEREPKLRKFIAGLGENAMHNAVSAAAGSIGRTRSLDEAVAFIDSFELDPDKRMSAITSVATGDPTRKPKEKIEWIMANVSADRVSDAVGAAIQSMSWQASKGLDEWVDSQPRGEIRDAAQAARAMGLASRKQFDDGFQRALDVDDQEKRQLALQTVIRHWKRRNPSAARDRLERAGLDPAEFGMEGPAEAPDSNQ